MSVGSSAAAASAAASCRFAVGARARGTLFGRGAGAHAADRTGEFMSMLASTRQAGDRRSAGERASSSEDESSSRFMHWAAGGVAGCASGILVGGGGACAWTPDRGALPCSTPTAKDGLHASLSNFCQTCRLRQTCNRRQPPCLPIGSVARCSRQGDGQDRSSIFQEAELRDVRGRYVRCGPSFFARGTYVL